MFLIMNILCNRDYYKDYAIEIVVDEFKLTFNLFTHYFSLNTCTWNGICEKIPMEHGKS